MSDRRFTDKPELDPQAVASLAENHAAMVGNRTLFPSTVVTVTESKPDRILVSGDNNRKIGKTVEKGKFKGYAIYMLSLEERATCPSDCHIRAACYGNAMHYARRHRIGNPATFYARLEHELRSLSTKHDGVLVRLHVLGDFPSVEYVSFWRRMLEEFGNVAAYGYTHRRQRSHGGDEIGDAVQALKEAFPERFRIRQSGPKYQPDGATVLDRVPRQKRGPDGELVCPAQMDSTACCATCGLCWEMAASKECIGFIKHGRHSDAALAEAYKKTDEKKFNDSLVAALPKAKAFARSLCKDAAKAEDLVQEAARRALANRDKFEMGTNFDAWFTTIIRNWFYQEARKDGRQVDDPDGVMTASLVSAENPAERLEAAEALARLEDMPHVHREVLRDAGLGLSLAEIAEKHNIAEGTAKSRVSRARTAFAEEIEKPRKVIAAAPSIDVAEQGVKQASLDQTMRRIRPIDLPSVKPAAVNGSPMIRRVKPTDLIVEGSYQRDLSGKSMKLIKKMVSGWDWAKFKPPVCAEADGGLFVIDGQHTAIAAASHPQIQEIPVMVVKRSKVAERADAFVSQNTERVAMSPLQVFHAEVTAGNKDAFEILKSAIRAGGTIPKAVPVKGRSAPGQITAITAVRRVFKADGIAKLDRILKIAVMSGIHPINSTLIYALQYIVKGGYFAETARETDEEIAGALRRLTSKLPLEPIAKDFAMDSGQNYYRAAAVLIATEITDPYDDEVAA